MVKKNGDIDSAHIWGDSNRFKLFISHLAEYKQDAALIKNELDSFGISSFVAHEDIKPGTKWKEEIKKALSTMDGFLALMHQGFHDSPWTDQEIGFALSRNVKIISINQGCVPQGFISQHQALSCDITNVPLRILEMLMSEIRMVDSYILCVKNCGSFDRANQLAKLLPFITELKKNQTHELITAFNENRQVNQSVGFIGGESRFGNRVYNNGDGLVFHLKRITKRDFEISNDGKIKENPINS